MTELKESSFENTCGCTALDMPEWREMTEQIDCRAKQPSHVACVSEDLKCWGAWDTTLRAKSQGHHMTDRLEERGVERANLPRRSSLKGRERAIVNQTSSRSVSKLATLKKLLRDGVERIMRFPERADTILNWTELKEQKSQQKWICVWQFNLSQQVHINKTKHSTRCS